MSAAQIVFLIFAFILLTGAIAVVTMRNLVHAALCMALCFFAVAGLFVLLEAPFLAMVSVMLGVGAISVLIVFAVMLTRGSAVSGRAVTRGWPLALAVAVLLFGGIMGLITSVSWAVTPRVLSGDTLQTLGVALVDPGQLLLPFEVASVLLLAALIGSIVVSRPVK